MPISEVFNIDCMKYMENIPDKWKRMLGNNSNEKRSINTTKTIMK